MYNFYPKKLVQPPGCASNILLIMKLTILLTFVVILQVSASTSAQKITLSEKNTPLNKVFEKIRHQTGYDFIVSTASLKQSHPVDIDLQNEDLEPALDKIFANQPLSFVIQEKMVVVSQKQKLPVSKNEENFIIPVTITGKVTDTAGRVLPGATIKISGTNKMVFADSEGVFAINAQKGDNIEVSFIGYNPVIFQVLDESFYRVIILHSSASKLNEVTVISTGYQTLPKERSTGAFTIIRKELYNQQVAPDVLSRLEFIANGVSTFRNNNNNTSSIMVRGLSTINGPTNPLIVVDNFPYEGDINNLNPNDVESITILKDAAAASIWGTKAGNGVIVITTKKGKYSQPLKIDFSASINIGEKPNLNYLTPISSVDQIAFERELFSKGYYDNQITSTQHPVLSPVVELLAKAATGAITDDSANQLINELKKNDVRNNFSKYIYQRSVNQQYYINLNGGSDKLNYLFSTGYDKDINSLSSGFDKLNLRSEASFRPVKNLQLTTGLTYTSSNNRTGKPGYGNINFLQPYQMLSDVSGNALTVTQTYGQGFKNNAALTGQLQDWNYYPLNDYQHNYSLTGSQDVLGNFGVNYNIITGLSIDIKYQYEKQQTVTNITRDAQSYFARNLINSFTQVDGSNVTNPIPKGGIMDLQNNNLTSSDLRGQINYTKDWNKSAIAFIVGEELRQLKNTSSISRNYGYDDNILTISPVDYTTAFPNYATQNPSPIPYINSLSESLNRFVSFYANGAYTYNNKYTISGSMRRDASNVFGVETNDKWTPLWSSGLAWDISKETFYGITAIPYLKFRATYGYSGNVDPSKSAVTTISYLGTSIYTNTPYSQVDNFSNPDLRWEKVRTTDIGLDFKFVNDRITGSIDYYQKKSTDLYATVPVDYTVGLGISTLTKNVATMQGHGFDLELNSLNINGPVKWLTNLNFNYYRDKVTKYYATTTDGSNYVNDSRNPIEGGSVWGIYTYKWAGLDAFGNPQGYLNGTVSEDYTSITSSGTKISDLIYNGPRFPVFYGTLGNTVIYKGFTLTARVAYNFGNYFRREALSYSFLATSGIGNGADYAKRWQKPGDESLTSVPSFTYPLIPERDNFYSGSSALIEKADCIRLQYVTLSYNLTNQQARWLPFKGTQFFLNANNLGIIWRANHLGIDPNYYYTTSTMPTPKTVAIGLRANL
jgi:TonB-linked SusC/RagA family outer membrane protein